jgi:DHA1 family tetracycline resistance protein-like MFS transporter
MGLLARRFSEKQLIFGGSILLSLSLLAWALTSTLWLLLVVLAPLALAGGVLSVATNSALTKSVYPEEVGGTLGLAASLGSLDRVVSPIVGAALLDGVSAAAPGILGALLTAWLIFYTWRRVLFVPYENCPE